MKAASYNMWCCIILVFSFALKVNTQYSYEELLEIIKYYNYTASSYVASNDASVYFDNLNTTTEEYGTYDFIVIGAGAGGTVVANRLTEINDWKVLLLEAGSYGDQFTDIPAASSVTKNTSYNWAYSTVPQRFACLGKENHKCSLPSGRGVGGSSLINGLMYSRATAIDFDKFAEQVQDDTWSFINVLPYFKKSENFVVRDPLSPVDFVYHSTGGYHNVEHLLPRNIFLESFLQSNEEIGWSIIDYNKDLGLGASSVQSSTRNGRRMDDGTAFIKPILYRKNIEVSTDSYVTKILINEDGKNAERVTFLRHGKSYVARASKEVILCAGVIGSPRLLMLSGVGPKDHLDSLEIPVLQDLEVGSNLRDHISYFELLFNSNYTLYNQTLKDMLQDYLQGYGILTTPTGIQGLGFYPSLYNNKSENADIEVVMFATDNDEYKFRLMIENLHTNSVGTLRLQSKNPAAYPLIDPGYLTDEIDLKILYEGLKLALNLSKTDAFKRMDVQLVHVEYPECDSYEYLSDEYWYCRLRHSDVACFHLVGTCPMGPDPKNGAVVDSKGKVYGISNLRVVDASIFPFTMSGHPHAQILMAAEKISDIIKAAHF